MLGVAERRRGRAEEVHGNGAAGAWCGWCSSAKQREGGALLLFHGARLGDEALEAVDWAVAETKGGRWVDREGSGKIPRKKRGGLAGGGGDWTGEDR